MPLEGAQSCVLRLRSGQGPLLSSGHECVAAVMPAPLVPVEIREFPEPDLPPGGALLKTRSPKCAARTFICGTAGWPACRIQSFPGM
jgi:hypothetical protein